MLRSKLIRQLKTITARSADGSVLRGPLLAAFICSGLLFTALLASGCNNRTPGESTSPGEATNPGASSKKDPAKPSTETNPGNKLSPDEINPEDEYLATTRATPSSDASLGKPNIPSPIASATSSIAENKPSDPAAKQLLEDCVKTYQTAQSYSDEAVWRMDVPVVNNPVNRSLDMRIAWERPNKLAIRTANVTSAWTTDTFETIAGMGDVRPFDNQRVVRPRPAAITWEWLMYNHLAPLLEVARSERPLALELILQANPVADWISNGNFQMLTNDLFDQVDCKKIEVTVGTERYVLWIDSQRKLILRCELPMAMLQDYLGPALSGVDPSKIRFSIDMVNAQVNQPVDWTPWNMPREPGQVLVRRFTEPPPREVPSEIGTQIQHVVLKDIDGKEVFDSAEPNRPVILLQWIDTSDVSRTFVDSVRALRQEIQKLGLSAFVDTLLVTPSPADEVRVALAKWNCDLPVALENNKELGGQCGVQRMLTSVILANGGHVQYIDPYSRQEDLLHVIGELKQGRNVAERLKKAVVDNEAQYASRLHRNIIDRDQVANLHEMHREIAPFPLSFYNMSLEWRTDLQNGSISGSGEFYPAIDSGLKGPKTDPSKIFSTGSGPAQVASLLDDQGNVIVIDQAGNQRTVATIPWEEATDADRIHVLTDPWSQRWVAVIPEGLPRFWYCSIPEDIFVNPQGVPPEISQKALETGETSNFATWVCLGETPILSIVTNQGRYLSLNPIESNLETRKSSVGSANILLNNVVPRISDKAGVLGWNSVWSDRGIVPWNWLSVDNDGTNAPPSHLPFVPEIGNWLWGRGKNVDGEVDSYLVGLEKSDTGETHAVLMNSAYEPLLQQTLSVLPRQCKLLAAAETADQQFFWLATAPNLVLHLRTAGNAAPDQMSFGQRIYGATILPDGNDLRLVVVLEKEVSCWKLVPKL